MIAETAVLVRVSKEFNGICSGSLVVSSLHYNFKTFLMGIPEKANSAPLVYKLGFWTPGCLESGCSDSGHLV